MVGVFCWWLWGFSGCWGFFLVVGVFWWWLLGDYLLVIGESVVGDWRVFCGYNMWFFFLCQ